MSVQRNAPDDPQEWLRRARSSLAKAREGHVIPEVSLEDLCFDAQQAAEKALKGLLIHLCCAFPYVHDLAELIARLDSAGVDVPEDVKDAVGLTEFAVASRYPGMMEPVTWTEYQQAVALASGVVSWCQRLIEER
jgi:HEPN domain-containing protein